MSLEKNNKKIKTPEELAKIIKTLKREGKKIGTLNGVFDILHKGHIHIIKTAKSYVDTLIIALNSDNSVKKNKGNLRPLNPLEDRMEVISAIEWVDYVTFFEETTPNNLLELLRPDIHFNDSSYGENCVEAPTLKKIGAKLILIDKLPTSSTTDIIKLILTRYKYNEKET